MHIEELPDDFDEKLDLNKSSPNPVHHTKPECGPEPPAAEALPASSTGSTIQDGKIEPQNPSVPTMGPEMPPIMAEMRSKTADEILAELNKSPLFMTDLEENDDLEAFKALAAEGTPSEIALQFKEHGNESFRFRAYRDAKEYYDKAIGVLQLEERKRRKVEPLKPGMPIPPLPKDYKPPSEDPKEVAEERSILETSLVNRAACNLELKNYRSCTLDCVSALKLNPRNLKAYYRSGRALLALEKIAEADDVCARGLELEPENKALKDLATKIIAKNEEVQVRQRKEAERLARERKEKITLQMALKARNINVSSTGKPPDMEDAAIKLVPDPADPASSLTFPTVLLYPIHLESDFIKAFGEMDSLNDHLGYIFPLPWDTKGEYTSAGVECYMETTAGGLIKVGKKMSLLKVLGTSNVQVIDDVVRIFVLPKAAAPGWIKEFKEKKATEKGT